MDIFKTRDDFCQFLESIIKDESLSPKVFLEEYEAHVLLPGTYSPFSDFIGQRDRCTVIFSRHKFKETETSRARCPDASDELELIADLSLNGETKTENGNHLLITTHNAVHTGQQSLASSRVYLTQQPSPCLNKESDATTKQVTCAQDNGLLPLPLNSARIIASLYALNSCKAGTPLLPDVWIVCERNNRKIVALGCAQDPPSLLAFTVKEKEHLSEKDVKAKEKNPLKNLVGDVFSEFHITGSSNEIEQASLSELKIQFSWRDPEILLSPPPECSEAVLIVSSKPGDIFSPVLSIYNELKSLYRLCQISNRELSWPAATEESEDVIASSDNKRSALECFIEELAHPLTPPSDVTVISPTSDNLIHETRTDLDFAERLWVFCHEMSSFGDLQVAFAEVFKAVLLGRVQPLIHRKSTSTLAGLLRQVLLKPNGITLQDVAVKLQMMLTETRLVACLIQLGIEKLKRDYRAFFVNTDICSADQLERFFTLSSFPLDQCLDLCRLHCILELNVSILKMLKVPSSVLSGFTKVAIEVFKKEIDYRPFARSPLFSLPLPPYSQALKSVVVLCSKLSPSTWCLTRHHDRSGEKPCSGRNSNVIYLMKDRPLHQCHAKPDSNSDQQYFYKCHYEWISSGL